MGIINEIAESPVIKGFSAFVLSNGFSLALFVERVIARLRGNHEKVITSDIDADSIVEMIYRDSANEG